MICNICAVVIQYVYNTSHWIVICIELLLNTTLILEVLINLCAMKMTFFQSYMNIIDLVLTILCTIFATIFIYDEYISPRKDAVNDEIYSEIDFVLLSCRYLFQIGRFSSLLNRSKVSAERLTADDIHLLKYSNTDTIPTTVHNGDIQLSSFKDDTIQHNSVLFDSPATSPHMLTNNLYNNTPIQYGR